MNDSADSLDTPAALIHAARPIFATHGFDGASVRAITTAAGANLGAITYHFGSKRDLYLACLEAAWESLRTAFDAKLDQLGGTFMAFALVVLAMGTAVFVAPYILLAAPAGYLADRFSKRQVIVFCKIGEAVIMARYMHQIDTFTATIPPSRMMLFR